MAIVPKAARTDTELDTVKKLNDAARWIGSRSLEWASGIRMLLLSLITERHAFFLGPPGVGKSQVIKDMLRCFDGYELYAQQMHPEKPVRDLVGYMSIPRYVKDGVIEYVVHKSLVMKRGIGWLGEIWLGNGSVLNALLGIANEGTITLGSQTFETRVVLLGDSNEMPDVVHVAEGDVKRKTLVALADRFLLRDRRPPCVRSRESQCTMARMAPDRIRNGQPPVSISEGEMDKLTATCRDMVQSKTAFPDSVMKKFFGVIEALRKEGIPISDRRWMWAREVLAASALLGGRNTIDESDLKTTRFWGWLTPAHISTVLEVLQDSIEMAHPKVMKEETACGKVYQELLDAAKSDPGLLTDTSKATLRISRGNIVMAQLSDSIRKLEALSMKHPDEGEEVYASMDLIKRWNLDVLKRFVGLVVPE